MKPYLMILLIALSYQAQSQDSMGSHSYIVARLAVGPQPELYGKRFTYTLMPAVERLWGRYAIQVQPGIMIPVAFDMQDTIDNKHLTGSAQWYTLRVSMRKYTLARRNANAYAGAEIFAGVHKTYRSHYYHNEVADIAAYYDAFLLTKRMAGICATAGLQTYIGKRTLIGLHSSTGIKFKYTTSTYRLSADNYSTNMHDMFGQYVDKEGFTAGWAAMLSVSIGYAFK